MVPPKALHVGVDPLAIAAELGEAVDHLLADLHVGTPGREGLADAGAEGLDVIEADLLGGVHANHYHDE
jgi:hypothetical protein